MIFRNDLEYLLLARPRTKEFLVAFPGIMLAVYCAVRRLPFWTALFGLAGTYICPALPYFPARPRQSRRSSSKHTIITAPTRMPSSRLAQLMGKRTFIYSQGIGPIFSAGSFSRRLSITVRRMDSSPMLLKP